MGDFNEGYNASQMVRLSQLLCPTAKTDSPSTFPTENLLSKIDYIFVSEGLEFKGLRAPHINCSDHLPLIFELRWEPD